MSSSKRKRSILDVFDGDDGDDIETLSVNPEFAARFEHNKQREELHRAKEKNPSAFAKLEKQVYKDARGPVAAEDESSSEEEDEDDGTTAKEWNSLYLDTLAKIKKRDQAIYNPEVHFFPDPNVPSDEEAEDEPKKKKKKKADKPKYLKDVIAEQAIAGEEEEDSEDEEDGGGGGRRTSHIHAYNEEQQNLRKDFLEALEDEDDEEEGEEGGKAFGGVLKPRVRAADESEDDSDVEKLAEEVFGKDDELDPNELFLKKYLTKMGWVNPAGAEDEEEEAGYGEEDEADAQHLLEADKKEADFNFRFEDNPDANVIGHPRVIEGTVRKGDERRKRARAEKAARKAADAAERETVVRHLKNVKRSEIEERMAQIQEVAGNSASAEKLMDELMTGDFDPEEYDRRMAEAFGSGFYEADLEAEEDAALERELNAAADVSDGDNDDDGGAAVGTAGRAANGDDADTAGAAAEVAAGRADIARMLEDYYKLDYEDTVAGMPTRFRYREVPKADYGLALEEILSLSDKDLNQIVGPSRLAPYREDGGLVKPNRHKMMALGVGKFAKHRQFGGGAPARGEGAWEDRRRSGGDGGGGWKERPSASAAAPVDLQAERRMSYAKLQLRKPDGGGVRDGGVVKKKVHVKLEGPRYVKGPVPVAVKTETAAGDGLTRVQRKNLKRSEKRASKRAASGGD